MNIKLATLATAILVASSGAANAACTFYEHNNYKGKFFRINSGECAYLVQGSRNCQGLPAYYSGDGINDKVSSVKITGGSKAYLYQHVNGSGKNGVVQGTSAPKIPGLNDMVSLVICK